MNINHRIGARVTGVLVGRDYDIADIQCAKVCYAVESILGDLQKNIVLACIFGLLGKIQEFLFCFLTVNLVRRFLGGIHMNTDIGCTLVSISVYVVAVAGGACLPLSWIWSVCLMVCTTALMITVAPLPSPNRPVYRGIKRRRIQRNGLIGLAVLSVCMIVYPKCSTFVTWTLILQIIEVGVVLVKERNKKQRALDTPVEISTEAERFFMECTQGYEARMNGLVHFPTDFYSMSRKERISAFNGFTEQEKDALMNLLTEDQRERLVHDIRCQAVQDFWKRK